jgi:hypothetical protein
LKQSKYYPFECFSIKWPEHETRSSGNTKSERARREGKSRGSERHYFGGRGQEIKSLGLKVPRQCPLVLLVQIMHMIEINFLYVVGRTAL